MTDADSLSPEVKEFVRVSTILTGFSAFELYGTGQAANYYDFILSQAKEELATLMEIMAAAPEADRECQAYIDLNLFNNKNTVMVNFTKSVIKLWYLGQWDIPFPPKDPDNPPLPILPSAESYPAGLVWDVIHAHPQGAKQQGFGAWSILPIGVEG